MKSTEKERHTIPTFSGYANLEYVGETLYATVYRAFRAKTQERVLIKVLKIENPTPAELDRFEHEYKLIQDLKSEGIVKVLDIIRADGRIALVMEDFDGISLKEYLTDIASLDFFLSIAVRLAETLNHLHAHNITHRNIKLANILYNPQTDTLKLSDFGSAAELTGLNESLCDSRFIEEALVYISPEQTGKMNCGVDYRTDFYSLGITFYEILTGTVPFVAKEPPEIIHSHIARMPVVPAILNPAIPVVVSNIIMKLLAKTTDERYQSSLALMNDLQECLNRLKSTGHIEPFEIGLHDISPKFNLSHDMQGHTVIGAPSHKLLDIATVTQVCQTISREIILDRLLQIIMHMCVTCTGAQRGFLILATDNRLSIEASKDLDKEEQQPFESLLLDSCKGISQAIVKYVYRSLKPLILTNASQQGLFINDPHVVKNHCKSILCIPLLSEGDLTGILYMENNLTTNAFTAECLEILGIITAQASISMENARLFDLATRDGQTKLFAHRYFQLLLDHEIDRSHRYGKPVSIVLMGIDNSKDFSNSYGHQMGEEALIAIAGLVKKKIRQTDIAARYSVEEFVLIFPETNLEQAMISAEKIRQYIENMEIPDGTKTLHVTISAGVATFPYHAADKQNLINSAQDALHKAEQEGKNRVCVGKKIN